jgi:hypothetical protein
VQKTLSAFGRIAMERARVFNCPMPELEEAAERAGMQSEKDESSLTAESSPSAIDSSG